MMKKTVFGLLLLMCLLACDKEGTEIIDGGNGNGGLVAQATYRITFTPDFTEDNFPQDYPQNPMFLSLIVAAHDSSDKIFDVGATPSSELQSYLLNEETSTFVNFLNSQGGQDSNTFIVNTSSGAAGPTQAQSVTITIDPDHTTLSIISKLTPSPDWFVGVSTFDLVNNDNSLVQFQNIDLNALDGGVDDGTTYTSDSAPSNPAQRIETISTPPLGSDTGFARTIGVISIERTDL